MQACHESPPRGLLQRLGPLALAALLGCGSGSGDEGDSPSSGETNLLLVTLDTTRADRIGCYGYEQARTPNLDALAAGGVRFVRAYAQTPLTLPSHASLLTGTFPPEHGLHDNGRRALGERLTTLAEVFHEKGFRTGAFVSAIALDASLGLDRGFDLYDDDLGQGTSPGQRVIQRRGDQVTDCALEWLGQSDKPFFLWVHYYDPHADYAPPADFAGGDPYDGEIAFMDSQIGRLLGWLDAQRKREQTLVVAIADHGESLGEHGEHTHASLIYEGTQRIPFLMSQPGRLPAGVEVLQSVQQVDLFPTLMQLYDWAVPDEVSGRSLAGVINGRLWFSGPVWIESEYAALNFGWSSLRGVVVRDKWKYIEAPTPELYDLDKDPGEQVNIAAEKPHIVKGLKEAIETLQESMTDYSGDSGGLSADLAHALSGLGYAQGSSAGGQSEATRSINPIEHIETLELYHAAIGFGNQGRFDLMLAPLESIVKTFPEAAGFRTQLGDVYRRLGREAEARRELQAALKLDDTYDPAHFYSAELERAAGNPDAAIAAYRKTLALRPTYVPAMERLGELLAAEGENEAALLLFEQLVASESARAGHWLGLADLHERLDHHGARLTALERAVQLEPEDLGGQNLLAWVLATSPRQALRDGARALKIADRCVLESGREHPEPLLTYSAAQAALGHFEAAQATLLEAIALAESQERADLIPELKQHQVSLERREILRERD